MKKKTQFENIVSPEKIYAAFHNRASMEERQEYEQVDQENVLKSVKNLLRSKETNISNPSYNYKDLSNKERLKKVTNLYKKIGKYILEILRKEYQHNEEYYKELKSKILKKCYNKVRTDKTGKVFITVNGLDYFGDIKGYEDLFVGNKLNFRKTFKSIVKELLNTLETDTHTEKGKTFLLNKKEN